MTIINRHLRNTIVFHIFLVLGITGIIDLMTSILNTWSYDLQANFQWFEGTLYVLMTLPIRLYELFPLITLIGCLSGLGSLANQSELTIMRAAGLSVASITKRVLLPVSYLLVFVALLGELVLPSVDQYADTYRAELTKNATSTKYGIWHREANRYIYIAAAHKNGDLGPVTAFEFGDDNSPVQQLHGASAQHQDGGWVLDDVQLSILNDHSMGISVAPTYLWSTDMTPKQLLQLGSSPSRMGLLELVNYQRYLANQGIDTASYQLALWNKLLMPVMALSLVLVAVSFIFGPLRAVSTGTRVFIGVMVGLVIKITQNILGPSSLIFGFDPAVAALLPVAVTTLLGVLLLRRVF
jgi:lipopolysaccharide export system permease protein